MTARPDLGLGLSERKLRLVERLETEDGRNPHLISGTSPIPRRPDPAQAPLSYAQERLWFLDQLVPGNPFYNCDVVLPAGALDPAALRRALTALTRRYDQLRCRFVRTPDGPRQLIGAAGDAAAELDLLDLRRIAPAQREVAARRAAERLARVPFDLTGGPLLRATLIRVDPDHHLLVLVLHHIICDGWSINLLVRELWDSYVGEVSGRADPRPAPALDYADFAAWQRSEVSGQQLEEQFDYWRSRLAGMTELTLPTDRLRPRIASYRGAFVPLHLPSPLVSALRALAGREQATTFMVLFTAFCATLARYAGTEDIAVGAPIANRNRAELEDVVGFFVNTLVLRVSMAGNPTFRELLGRTRDAALAAYRHQDLPFERLVHHLRPERDLGRNPLVQVVAQHFQTARVDTGGERDEASPVELSRGTAKFDLRLDTWDTAEAIRGQFEYSLDLFDRATAVTMLSAFVRLLESGVRHPDLPLSEIELVSAAERPRLVHDLNRTERPYAFDGGVHRAVERQVRARPDAIALDDGREPLSYRELWRRSGQVAAALQSRGLAPGSLVAIALPRGAAVVIAQLGVLRAGCAYVPLDPTYPRARLQQMLEDSCPAVLLTEQPLAAAVPAEAADLLLLDELADGDPSPGPCRPATPDQLAYLMYTSGTSGRPKGVLIPHRGISALVIDPGWITLTPDDVVAFSSNVSFDAATFEVWAALVHGARLVVIDHDTLLTPHLLARRLRDTGVTVDFITTALFRRVVEEVPDAFATVRVLQIGGSAFDVTAARRMYDAGAPAEFFNMYGPTECTTYATAHRLLGPPSPDRLVPIGRPIPRTTTYVVDDLGRPVPIGMPGELWIGGDGVALGYHARPELTAGSFVPDQFGRRPGALLYRTGDRVRRRPDGAIEFLGRVDRQVKVRGFRVELNEIEQVLRAHPAVDEVVVEARPRPDGDPRLVAYVRATPGTARSEPTPDGAPDGGDLVQQWRQYYDEVLYQGRDEAAEPDEEDLSGWVSSYTGEAIPRETMREQVRAVVDQVLELRPRRLLEVGCGSGLLAFPLLPHLERYVGTDFSAAVVDRLRRRLPVEGQAGGARIELLAADQLDQLEDDGPFDVVLLNSVVQYFPSVDYLDRVLTAAVARTRVGGTVLVGDVRLLPLMRAFHTSVAVARAAPALSVDALERRVVARLDQDNELVLGPSYFHRLAERLPAVTGVSVELKRGRSDSELTRFRADVRICVGGMPAALPQKVWTWRPDVDELDHLRRRLRAEKPVGLLVRGLPNGRLAADRALLERLAQARPDELVRNLATGIAEAPSPGVDPDEVRSVAGASGYRTWLTPTPGRETETFDVLAVRTDGSPTPPVVTFPPPSRQRTGAPVASDPLRGNFLRRVVPELRAYAAAQLPDYMQPAAWVLVPEFPLDGNGKVDPRRLPPPEEATIAAVNSSEPPTTPLEATIADVWASILGVDQVGRRDGFFHELGGNSLLATQVISRLRARLGVELPLRALFENPTVETLATHLLRLAPPLDEVPPSTSTEPVPDVDALSDERVDALLGRLLADSDGHR